VLTYGEVLAPTRKRIATGVSPTRTSASAASKRKLPEVTANG